jgi:hypothetical protein
LGSAVCSVCVCARARAVVMKFVTDACRTSLSSLHV